MKRSELRRTSPLVAKTALERKTPQVPALRSGLRANQAAHRQPKAKRRNTVPAKVRNALKERSGGVCEIAQPGCTWQAVEFAHRKKVGAGGRHGDAKVAHDVLSNALHLCWNCHHRLCHARPVEAYASGWMLQEFQDPAAERVLYRGAFRWLTDDGRVLTALPTTTEEVA